MHTFLLFFGWPNGGVWSNLVASAILGIPAFVWARRKMLREFEKREIAAWERHAKTKDLINSVHDRLDRMEGGADDSIRT